MTKRPDLDTIGALLADIREQFDALHAMADNADPIEIELFEATVNFLSANVSVFRKTYLPLTAENETRKVEAAAETEAAQVDATTTDEVIEEDDLVEEADIVEEAEAQPFVLEAPVEESVDSVSDEAVPLEPTPVEPTPVEPTPVEPIEQAPERPLSLNEILANQRHPNTQQNPFASRMEHARATDLKTAINLNDKLLFIKDLFNGYSLAYSEAIELLNRYDNMAEADAFLQSSYAVKNEWASKQETVDKFYKILQKRFTVQ